MRLFVPALGVMRLAEVGLTGGSGAASRRSWESSGGQHVELPVGGHFSDSNYLGGNNWQLDIESVIIIYQVVKNRGKCLTGLSLKKNTPNKPVLLLLYYIYNTHQIYYL